MSEGIKALLGLPALKGHLVEMVQMAPLEHLEEMEQTEVQEKMGKAHTSLLWKEGIAVLKASSTKR